MEKREILTTRYGEMLDLISCFAIYNGNAEPGTKTNKLSNDEIFNGEVS